MKNFFLDDLKKNQASRRKVKPAAQDSTLIAEFLKGKVETLLLPAEQDQIRGIARQILKSFQDSIQKLQKKNEFWMNVTQNMEASILGNSQELNVDEIDSLGREIELNMNLINN